MFSENLWVVYVLIFGAVLLAIQGGYWFIARNQTEKKAINRRLALGTNLEDPMEVLEALRRERGILRASDVPALSHLNNFLTQTGLRIDGAHLFLWAGAVGVPLFIVFGYAFGFGFAALSMTVVATLAGILLFLVHARSKRIRRFGEQLPEALDVIVRGLRAGHPFRVAVALVSREMPDPIGTEFGIFGDEITFGLDVESAVDNLCRRVGHDDLAFFAVSISIQNQTGGNLAEVLSRLSQLMRNRSKLRLKVRALTSEGRLSALFLSIMPFFLFGVISLLSASFYGGVKDSPAILPAVIIGLLMLTAGNVIMYKMVNFKV